MMAVLMVLHTIPPRAVIAKGARAGIVNGLVAGRHWQGKGNNDESNDGFHGLIEGNRSNSSAMARSSSASHVHTSLDKQSFP